MINQTTYTASEINDIWIKYQQKKRIVYPQMTEQNNDVKTDSAKKHLELFQHFGGEFVDLSKISIPELFDHYEKIDFIYPDKKKKLQDHITLIQKNWEKAFTLKNEISIFLKVSGEVAGQALFSSLQAWRPTCHGLQIHHLTSNYPSWTCATILAIMSKAKKDQYVAGQFYYRPDNVYPARVFGELATIISPEYMVDIPFHYLEVPAVNERIDTIHVKQCTNKHQYGICDFAKQIRGPVYTIGEELNCYDIEMNNLDNIYQKAGLRRRRYIWMAFHDGKQVAAIIVNRGPFGLNLSFIENKCDILLIPDIDTQLAHKVLKSLLYHASTAYFSNVSEIVYPVDYIPVMADSLCYPLLLELGAKEIRKYNQSIWLMNGFDEWSPNMENIFEPVLADSKKIKNIAPGSETYMKQHNEYFMEHPLDNWRLERKVNPRQFVHKYIKKYLKKAANVLEIGCGPGIIAKFIGENYPDISLTVIDKSHEKTKKTNENTKFLEKIQISGGEIYKLPLRDNSYDFIFCRLLFQYLKEPQTAVNEMMRVCKKGGTIMVQDLDGQMLSHYPEKNDLQTLIERISKIIAENQGFDPYVGRKLFSFFNLAGLKQIKIRFDEYHKIAGTIDKKNYKLWEAKLEIALPELIWVLGSEKKARQLKDDYLNYLLDKKTFTFSHMMTAYGIKE
ncbi:Methyltransferase type 11 domain protein [Candidatus Magnetomorum sp. HK-1]|nr:Methyltransferase type 11 domain protein [Candidatus Magnetomorum sp. HK-1]